jgi:hypothetical protein
MPICGNMHRTTAKKLKRASLLGLEPEFIEEHAFIDIASLDTKSSEGYHREYSE